MVEKRTANNGFAKGKAFVLSSTFVFLLLLLVLLVVVVAVLSLLLFILKHNYISFIFYLNYKKKPLFFKKKIYFF
jgi:hypothetical protein